MIISFLIFLLLFAIVGIASIVKSKNNKTDYYLASSTIPAPLVGLSAVATNSSGYMFIGVIGYTYVNGLSSIWLMLGLIIGDFIGSLFVHAKLREATERTGELSFAGVISRWNGGKNLATQRIIGGITFIFLIAYASAQFIAGSKALHVLLNWPNWAGAAIGATMVTLYCISGGIRASIWTDAAQSVVMMIAMAVLLVYNINYFGGVHASVAEMRNYEGFLNWFPNELAMPGLAGILLFVIGWGFAGLSVVGQPHIMVRFMTLSNAGKMNAARLWYYIWYTAFFAMCIVVGMYSKIYLSNNETFDAELALPLMAQGMLPSVLVGLVLAGIFAATISTADSLVLSCSSAITHDLLPHKIEKPGLLKVFTACITALALILAFYSNESVFNLVILAWSALASAFGPLLLFLALGRKVSQTASIVAIFGGLITALLWRHYNLHDVIYEGFPGICSGLLLLFLFSKLNFKKAG